MRIPIHRRVYFILSVLFGGVSLSLCLLAAADVAVAQGCNSLNSGCYQPSGPPTGCASTNGCTHIIGWGTVTCNNASAVCEDGSEADAYTQTQASAFYKCASVSCKTYPACTDGCVTCAAAYLFRSALLQCTTANRCTVDQVLIQSCGAKTGTSCDTPCPH